MNRSINSKPASELWKYTKLFVFRCTLHRWILPSGAERDKRLLPGLPEEERLCLEKAESVNCEQGFMTACFDSLVAYCGIWWVGRSVTARGMCDVEARGRERRPLWLSGKILWEWEVWIITINCKCVECVNKMLSLLFIVFWRRHCAWLSSDGSRKRWI